MRPSALLLFRYETKRQEMFVFEKYVHLKGYIRCKRIEKVMQATYDFERTIFLLFCSCWPRAHLLLWHPCVQQ